jgi:hypothetical protein
MIVLLLAVSFDHDHKHKVCNSNRRPCASGWLDVQEEKHLPKGRDNNLEAGALPVGARPKIPLSRSLNCQIDMHQQPGGRICITQPITKELRQIQ